MRYCKAAPFVVACLTAASPNTAVGEEVSRYVIMPTADVNLNIGRLPNLGNDTDWPESIRAYTDTSDRAMATWCNDISSSHPALAVSAKSITKIGLASCPAADSSYTMTIKIPKEDIPHTYGNLSGLDNGYLYLYLRSQNSEAHVELSGVGQRLLFPPYEGQAANLFSVRDGGAKDTFFPNFCQMCGCCSEGLK